MQSLWDSSVRHHYFYNLKDYGEGALDGRASINKRRGLYPEFWRGVGQLDRLRDGEGSSN